jgi:ribonuclease D
MTEPLGSRPEDASALALLGEELAASPAIGLDTEFMRERTYRAQLCLLQIATPERAVCIDPLGPMPLDALAAGIGSTSVVKIMHAARQDLEVLWPLFGTLPRVFDTQVAGALAGFPGQVGYADLVRQILGITLPKGQTRTDWSRRPLTPAQIEYALDDVAHLAALRDELQQRVDKLGRTAWLEEELEGLGRPEQLFVAPEQAWERLKGLAELDPWRIGLARELAAWRERRASDRNRPRSWILSDVSLRGVVLQVPRTAEHLSAIEEMTPGFVQNSGAEILEMIGAQSPPGDLPPPGRRPRPDPAIDAAVKRLGEVSRRIAQDAALGPEILATRRELEALVRGDREVRPLRGWRRGVVGEALLAAL